MIHPFQRQSAGNRGRLSHWSENRCARSADSLSARTRSRRGFTLVEMLVVISIIAILASLIVGALPAVAIKKATAATRVELEQLVASIQNYKSKKGFFPPDNPNNVATNQLYYELAGSTNLSTHFDTFLGDRIDPATLKSVFGIDGLMNSFSGRERDVENFLPSLRSSQTTSNSLGVILLATPFRRTGVSTWRYRSTNPTHNPDSFDLWAEIPQGQSTVIVGNWKE